MQLMVNLDAYSGPLDLLLDLISKQKVDIYDIEISKITRHYLEVIENSIHSEDTDISAFLIMSSTLVEIKSRSLIPKNTDEDEDEIVTREQLIERLVEYRKFKKVGEYFRNLETKYLRELSQKNGIIISTGGGAVKREENMKILKEKGIVVFLSRKIEDIAKENHEARPLLKDINNIYKLYDERIELYKRYSDIIIENNGTLQEVIDRTAEEIEKIFTK